MIEMFLMLLGIAIFAFDALVEPYRFTLLIFLAIFIWGVGFGMLIFNILRS